MGYLKSNFPNAPDWVFEDGDREFRSNRIWWCRAAYFTLIEAGDEYAANAVLWAASQLDSSPDEPI